MDTPYFAFNGRLQVSPIAFNPIFTQSDRNTLYFANQPLVLVRVVRGWLRTDVAVGIATHDSAHVSVPELTPFGRLLSPFSVIGPVLDRSAHDPAALATETENLLQKLDVAECPVSYLPHGSITDKERVVLNALLRRLYDEYVVKEAMMNTVPSLTLLGPPDACLPFENKHEN